MVPILRRTFAGVDVRTRGVADATAAAEADIVASFETLGAQFGYSSAALRDALVPLQADSALAAQFRESYREKLDALVGISWWSSSGKKDLPDLESWSLILERPHSTFVSLQYRYDDLFKDLEALRTISHGRLINDDSVDQLVDLDRFAAQVSALDAVVTVSNTTIHIAGDFGVPAILIRDDRPYGMWPVSGTSPWYPNVIIVYRNGRAWPSVFAEVREKLEQLLESAAASPRAALRRE
jgi:hypothetical protein